MTACELEEERAPARLRLELKQDESIAPDLLNATQLCPCQLRAEPLVEGTLRACVALESVVLEVEPACLWLTGEVDPEDRDVWAARAWDEREDGVLGRARLHVAEGAALQQRPELFDELPDLSVVEVQLSSSSE